jgi:hypothetical protein
LHKKPEFRVLTCEDKRGEDKMGSDKCAWLQ